MRTFEGGSAVRAEVRSGKKRLGSSDTSSRRRYRYAFVARYLKPLVFDVMVSRDCRQYEVAEWLGVSDRALSEYLTGQSHPSGSQLKKLEPLGSDGTRLRRAMLADKLSHWMDSLDVTPADVDASLRRIEAEAARRLPSR